MKTTGSISFFVNSLATPASVGEIPGFVALLQTARSDGLVRARLLRLLSLPDERRKALVHTWVSDLLLAKAPRDLVLSVACLQNDEVAVKAHSLMTESERSTRAVRFAAALMLVCTGAFFGLWLAQSLFDGFLNGLPEPPGTAALAGLCGLSVLCVAPWVTASCWIGPGRPSAWRAAALTSALSLALAALSCILPLHVFVIRACPGGEQALQSARYADSIDAYTVCLGFANLATSERVKALDGRSRAYRMTRQNGLALADLEASFTLRPSLSYRDLFRHANLLRDAGKLPESISTRAEAHWCRGLALEAARQPQLARRDFEECAALLARGAGSSPAIEKALPDIREKLRQYAIQVPATL